MSAKPRWTASALISLWSQNCLLTLSLALLFCAFSRAADLPRQQPSAALHVASVNDDADDDRVGQANCMTDETDADGFRSASGARASYRHENDGCAEDDTPTDYVYLCDEQHGLLRTSWVAGGLKDDEPEAPEDPTLCTAHDRQATPPVGSVNLWNSI